MILPMVFKRTARVEGSVINANKNRAPCKCFSREKPETI
jgi:hypothetical protein